MRTLSILLLSLFLVNNTWADGLVKLRLNITNNLKNNNYFVCVDDGCYSVVAASAGKVYLINDHQVTDLSTADVAQGRLYFQTIPSSCQMPVDNDKTLVISGRLTASPSNVSLSHVSCKVV